MRHLVAILVISSLIACASPGPDVPSIAALRGIEDPAAAVAVSGPPPADRARLVIASGRWDDTGMGKTVLARETSVRGDIVIQGQRVAFFANGQALVIDLPPGAYALRWEMRDIFSNSPNVLRHVTALPIEAVLRAGTITTFTADVVDRARLAGRYTALDAMLGTLGEVRIVGMIFTVLSPVADPQTLLAGARTILSPQPDRLAAIPGARLAGR